VAVHASRDEPQYKVRSDTTEHITMHKGSALRKLRT
jgi:Hypervirulence associated proteins TUDOR domain